MYITAKELSINNPQIDLLLIMDSDCTNGEDIKPCRISLVQYIRLYGLVIVVKPVALPRSK
jgi:hypothetical protein